MPNFLLNPNTSPKLSVPEVETRLQSKDDESVVDTLEYLLRLTPHTKPFLLHVLKHCLNSKSPRVLRMTYLFLEHTPFSDSRGDPVPEFLLLCNSLVATFKHPNEHVLVRALRLLPQLRSSEVAAQVAPVLAGLLTSPFLRVRKSALAAWHRLALVHAVLCPPETTAKVAKMVRQPENKELVSDVLVFLRFVDDVLWAKVVQFLATKRLDTLSFRARSDVLAALSSLSNSAALLPEVLSHIEAKRNQLFLNEFCLSFTVQVAELCCDFGDQGCRALRVFLLGVLLELLREGYRGFSASNQRLLFAVVVRLVLQAETGFATAFPALLSLCRTDFVLVFPFLLEHSRPHQLPDLEVVLAKRVSRSLSEPVGLSQLAVFVHALRKKGCACRSVEQLVLARLAEPKLVASPPPASVPSLVKKASGLIVGTYAKAVVEQVSPEQDNSGDRELVSFFCDVFPSALARTQVFEAALAQSNLALLARLGVRSVLSVLQMLYKDAEFFVASTRAKDFSLVLHKTLLAYFANKDGFQSSAERNRCKLLLLKLLLFLKSRNFVFSLGVDRVLAAVLADRPLRLPEFSEGLQKETDVCLSTASDVETGLPQLVGLTASNDEVYVEAEVRKTGRALLLDLLFVNLADQCVQNLAVVFFDDSGKQPFGVVGFSPFLLQPFEIAKRTCRVFFLAPGVHLLQGRLEGKRAGVDRLLLPLTTLTVDMLQSQLTLDMEQFASLWESCAAGETFGLEQKLSADQVRLRLSAAGFKQVSVCRTADADLQTFCYSDATHNHLLLLVKTGLATTVTLKTTLANRCVFLKNKVETCLVK